MVTKSSSFIRVKEGFATLYAYYALHLARPTERWMEWFNQEAIPIGMEEEYFDTITQECESNLHVGTCYINTVFERAASVLNMFRQILGDSAWQVVIRNFLKNHQLDIVRPSDLYREMAKVVEGSRIIPENMTIEQIMNTWINNDGLPILKVIRHYNDSTITVSQNRMYYHLNYVWIIPYNYAQESNPSFNEIGPIHWLAEPSTVITTNASYNEWIMFNKRHFGLYRINYDEQNWKLLAQALRSNISCMPRENRALLLADALHFHEQNQLDKSILLDLLNFLSNETETLVWYAALPVIDSFKSDLKEVKYQDNFKTFVNHLTKHFYNNIKTAPSTSLYDESVYKRVTFLACQVGNPDCLSNAYDFFRVQFLANSTDLLPEDEIFAFCFGSQQTNDLEFNWLLEHFEASSSNEWKQGKLMRYLLCTKQPARLRTVIERINQVRKRFNTVVEGLTTELGAEQFWILADLLQEESFASRLRIGLVTQMLLAMNHRKQSEQAHRVHEALEDKYKDKMYESHQPYWYFRYMVKKDDTNNHIDNILEEYVRNWKK